LLQQISEFLVGERPHRFGAHVAGRGEFCEQVEWIEDQIEGQLDEVKRLAKIVDSLTLLTKADASLVQLAELVEEAF